MHINAGEISKIIKEQIQNYEQRVDATETGTVLSVGDGIARVYGVQNAMSMELLEFLGGLLPCLVKIPALKKAIRSNVPAASSPCRSAMPSWGAF